MIHTWLSKSGSFSLSRAWSDFQKHATVPLTALCLLYLLLILSDSANPAVAQGRGLPPSVLSTDFKSK